MVPVSLAVGSDGEKVNAGFKEAAGSAATASAGGAAAGSISGGKVFTVVSLPWSGPVSDAATGSDDISKADARIVEVILPSRAPVLRRRFIKLLPFLATTVGTAWEIQ